MESDHVPHVRSFFVAQNSGVAVKTVSECSVKTVVSPVGEDDGKTASTSGLTSAT